MIKNKNLIESPVESLFLRALFSALKDKQYCVLRNYASLPDSFGGSDLDLAILPEDKDILVGVIYQIAAGFGGGAIVDYTSSGRFMRFLGYHNGVWWGAAIDLFWMMEYRGVEYIPSSKIIDRSVEYRGIRVARDDDATVTALIKELLSNGRTRKDYFPQLVEIYRIQGKEAFELIDTIFSPEAIAQLGHVLVAGKDKGSNIVSLVRILRRDVLRRGVGSQLEGMLRNIILRLHRLIKPAGVCIAVTGTDGSGKSTLIKAITPILEQALHSKIHYEHLRPNWLPDLGVAAGMRKKGDGAPVTDPHAQPPSGFMASLLRLSYYWLDYTLGYWIKVYPRVVKRPHVTLFDRYFYDVLIDPRRMRIRLPRWISRLAFGLVPKPDLVIALGADPKTLYERKPETSLVEVSSQVVALKKLVSETENAVWVDTGQDVKDSVNYLLKAIMMSMNNRYR